VKKGFPKPNWAHSHLIREEWYEFLETHPNITFIRGLFSAKPFDNALVKHVVVHNQQHPNDPFLLLSSSESAFGIDLHRHFQLLSSDTTTHSKQLPSLAITDWRELPQKRIVFLFNFQEFLTKVSHSCTDLSQLNPFQSSSFPIQSAMT
jgi:hypothetical protein